jgi:hypothetical protein
MKRTLRIIVSAIRVRARISVESGENSVSTGLVL